MVMETKTKICLAASSGGHLSQLLRLADCWQGHEVFFVTTSNVVKNELLKYGSVYVVGECNRQQPLRVFKVLFSCIRIIFREKPRVVISTGAACGCIMSFLAKATGARIVWIDSITNVERISLSGRMVRYIADLFLVQWPDLVRGNGNIEYVGAII
jgi:UDP-N-acetylglucosamine:LPS N-acetylglucosamine transferase